MDKISIQLVSADQQTILGTAEVPTTGFPMSPQAVIWKGKAFIPASQYGGGTPSYVEQFETVSLEDNQVQLAP